MVETDVAADLTVEIGPGICDAETRTIRVLLRSKESGSTAERSVTWADLQAGARPRALALATSELIRETRTRSKREPSRDEAGPSAAPSGGESNSSRTSAGKYDAGRTEDRGDQGGGSSRPRAPLGR